MVLPVDLGFGDTEDIIEEECTKVGYVVALPVLDASFQVLDGRVVLRPSLRLVDLISDALRSSDAGLEFLDVRVVGITDRLQERLS